MVALVITGLVVVGLVAAMAWQARRRDDRPAAGSADDPSEVTARRDDRSGFGPV